MLKCTYILILDIRNIDIRIYIFLILDIRNIEIFLILDIRNINIRNDIDIRNIHKYIRLCDKKANRTKPGFKVQFHCNQM